MIFNQLQSIKIEKIKKNNCEKMKFITVNLILDKLKY